MQTGVPLCPSTFLVSAPQPLILPFLNPLHFLHRSVSPTLQSPASPFLTLNTSILCMKSYNYSIDRGEIFVTLDDNTPCKIVPPLLILSLSAEGESGMADEQWSPAIEAGVPEGGSDGLPILFTLLHPMDDFCPTTFRRSVTSKTATLLEN